MQFRLDEDDAIEKLLNDRIPVLVERLVDRRELHFRVFVYDGGGLCCRAGVLGLKRLELLLLLLLVVLYLLRSLRARIL